MDSSETCFSSLPPSTCDEACVSWVTLEASTAYSIWSLMVISSLRSLNSSSTFCSWKLSRSILTMLSPSSISRKTSSGSCCLGQQQVFLSTVKLTRFLFFLGFLVAQLEVTAAFLMVLLRVCSMTALSSSLNCLRISWWAKRNLRQTRSLRLCLLRRRKESSNSLAATRTQKSSRSTCIRSKEGECYCSGTSGRSSVSPCWMSRSAMLRVMFIRRASLAFVFGEAPLLAGGVAEQVVELLAALHVAHESLLAAVLLEVGEEEVDCLHGHPQRGHRVDDAVVAVLLEGLDVDIRRLSELGHVGQQEHVALVLLQLPRHYLELLGGVQPFREDHVRPCVYVALRPRDALLQPEHPLRVRPRADHELPVRHLQGGLAGDLDLVDHLLLGDELLAVEVPAALREHLVLNVQPRGSRVEVVADRPCAHLALAEAGVRVGDDWQVGEGGDVLDDRAELVERAEADVGYPR